MALSRWPTMLRLLAGFSLGGLLVPAYAPVGLGLAAPIVLALFFVLLRHALDNRQAAVIGYAFGLGLFGFGVFWLRNSINQFGGITPPLGLMLTLLFIAVVAVYFALMAWFLYRLGERRGKVSFMLLAAPLAWSSVELLRAYLFTGFPWLSIGYTQSDLPLGGFAPLFGVLGMGYLVAVSGGLLSLWRCHWAMPSLLALWAAGHGLSWVDWTHPSGGEIKVAVVQGNIPQVDKWRPSMFDPTLALYQRLSDQVADAQLLIWPETAIPAFDDRIEDSVLLPLQERMRKQGRDLLTGIVARHADGRYYNAMLAMGRSGRQVYYKRHLVPFGEYLPLPWLLDPVLDFLDIPMSAFSAGNGQPHTMKLAGHRAGVDICYEDAFGNEVAATLPQAEFLINASNDAWFGDSLAPHQHLQIARLRAMETGRYLVRATNTGISAVIGPDGRVERQVPQFESTVLDATIVPMQGMTPYARWKDAPVVVLVLLLSMGMWLTRQR